MSLDHNAERIVEQSDTVFFVGAVVFILAVASLLLAAIGAGIVAAV
jgi:hypothetical protein